MRHREVVRRSNKRESINYVIVSINTIELNARKWRGEEEENGRTSTPRRLVMKSVKVLKGRKEEEKKKGKTFGGRGGEEGGWTEVLSVANFSQALSGEPEKIIRLRSYKVPVPRFNYRDLLTVADDDLHCYRIVPEINKFSLRLALFSCRTRKNLTPCLARG